MYFVTGGAFQGKRKWVQQILNSAVKHEEILWINGYHQELPLKNVRSDHRVMVIEGLERLIQKFPDREGWQERLKHLVQWKNEHHDRTLYIIGCEVGLGVVPMNKEERFYRDVVGWVYQDVAKNADVVVRIWCGLPQILKEEIGE